MKPITRDQNRALWGAIGELARVAALEKSEAETSVRTWANEISGRPSLSKLDAVQAGKLLSRINQEIGRYKPCAGAPQAAPVETLAGLPTPTQQDVLSKLFAQVGYIDQRSRSGFCRRQTGKPWPQNQADVTALMRALTDMVSRAADVDAVRALLGRLEACGALTGWERGFVADVARQALAARWRPRPHQLAKLEEIGHARLSEVA